MGRIIGLIKLLKLEALFELRILKVLRWMVTILRLDVVVIELVRILSVVLAGALGAATVVGFLLVMRLVM